MFLQNVSALSDVGFSHVLRTITIKSNKVSYESRAITIGSKYDFHKPRALTIPIRSER